MDDQGEISEFPRSRRARLTPDRAGIICGGRRRVTGLRREEVVMLAGVSPDSSARLERGNLAGASAEVLESLASALHLDEAETAQVRTNREAIDLALREAVLRRQQLDAIDALAALTPDGDPQPVGHGHA